MSDTLKPASPSPAEVAERAISVLSAAEVDRLLVLVAAQPRTGSGTPPLVAEPPPGSPAFRVAHFYLRQAIVASTAKGQIDTEARKRVIHLTECLHRQRAANPAPPRRGASTERALVALAHLIHGRAPNAEDVEDLAARIANGMSAADLLTQVTRGHGDWVRRSAARAPFGLSDSDFITAVYENVIGNSAPVNEVIAAQARLTTAPYSRHDMLMGAFGTAIQNRAAMEADIPHKVSFQTPGAGPVLTEEAWATRAADTEGLARARAALRPKRPYDLAPGSDIAVSIITSLWCGGAHIEAFLDNILAQTCLDGRAELIIIDAASPEGEAEVIARRTLGRSDVIYHRTESRIGIYAAWNLGVKMARGRYLTNANLDDIRREDSIAIQAGALDAHPWADIVYQDFITTLDDTLDWSGAAAFGFVSNLPPVTPRILTRFNLPHHAPMWRRQLHDELGLFDESMMSAGDADFWQRCLAAGKRFFKVNEPHAVYFHNPRGLSTRPDGAGRRESTLINRRMTPVFRPAHLDVDIQTFAMQHLGLPGPVPANSPRLPLVHSALRALGQAHRGAPPMTGATS